MLLAPSVGSYWPQFSIVGEFAGADIKICRGSPVKVGCFGTGLFWKWTISTIIHKPKHHVRNLQWRLFTLITNIKLITKPENSRLVQIESICRQQYKINKNDLSFFDMVKNIVGKGENADNQHFLLFQQCFQRAFYSWVLKSLDCVVKS